MGYAYDYLPQNNVQLRSLVRYAEMAFGQHGLTVRAVEDPAPELSKAKPGTMGGNGRAWRYENEDHTWIEVSDPNSKRSVTLSFNGHSMLADGYMPTGEEYTVKVARGKEIGGEITIANAPLGTQIGDWMTSYESRIPGDVDASSRNVAVLLGGNLPAQAYSDMQGAPFDKTPLLAAAIAKYLSGEKTNGPLQISLG